jgi:hypothetical protein
MQIMNSFAGLSESLYPPPSHSFRRVFGVEVPDRQLVTVPSRTSAR